jgi:hypothetical protein
VGGRGTHVLYVTEYPESQFLDMYANSIVGIVKKCMANPQIAKSLVRFPVVPQKEFRYPSAHPLHALIGIISLFICNSCREMYHGMQWRTNRRFYAPMVVSHVGHIFLNDFVQYIHEGTEHVCCIQQFLCQVIMCVYKH